ncbi:hypothetical protein CFC21_014479 [Triticum aestivum]|uniref:FACT complex subunit n=2 Tax=Triticum aestivum TaxID=4565 RepID=A0A9R1IZB6_WHEAT|nr:hypothetical protein CFC21_014479 [Triticum aestivum]
MADNSKEKLGSGAAHTINLETFSRRLNVFYDHWNENKSDLWASSDAIAIATPPPSEDLRHLKSTALDVWFLGYDEFPETIIVFMQKQIHFLCSCFGSDIVLHVKSKNGDGIDLMDDNTAKVICWICVQLADVTHGFPEIFAVEGATKIICVKKTACLTSSLMKNFVVPTMEKVIDEERKVSHLSLMYDTEKVIIDPLKAKENGGKFDLRPGASSNDDYLYYDPASIIICATGSRYSNYCSNVARTFLTLLKAQEASLAACKPGNQMSAVFKAAVAVFDDKTAEILTNCSKAVKDVAYSFNDEEENVNDVPYSRELVIQVDQRNEGVLLPIYGSMIPFHVSTVKTTSNSERREYLACHSQMFDKAQGAIYLKMITLRSKDPRHSSEVVQQIKTLRRQVASREPERATLVTQEKLQQASTLQMRLNDVWIRPAFGGRGRKLTGTLQAHVNGFRCSTSRADETYVFFQPAEKEMITLLHIHCTIISWTGRTESTMEFQNYINKVNDHWSQPQFKGLDLEFHIPLRELGFHGVPYKASAFIIPTSTCLVELIETPFLVVTLGEIEIVNLERVGFGTKKFDMAIVFNDFKKDVLRIDSIQTTSLDAIKEWVDTTDLKYYESRLYLNWRPILKTIIDDPQKFVDDDKGYEPSAAEPESESEDEDSDSASLVESDEDEEED